MDIYEKDSYRDLVVKNCYNALEFLLKEGLDFAVASFTNVIEFNPPIPTEVVEFDESALFVIANYTKDSTHLTKTHISFEAGFGESNFGSTLTIPLEAIMQLIIDEDIIHISYYEPKIKVDKNSMDLLLNNPENQKLLKKRANKK